MSSWEAGKEIPKMEDSETLFLICCTYWKAHKLSADKNLHHILFMVKKQMNNYSFTVYDPDSRNSPKGGRTIVRNILMACRRQLRTVDHYYGICDKLKNECHVHVGAVILQFLTNEIQHLYDSNLVKGFESCKITYSKLTRNRKRGRYQCK